MEKNLSQGVYFVKDGAAVSDYEEGVEKERLLVIGKYCQFYLSIKDLGRGTFDEAQKKAASLGKGWACPDSFQGRTIGLMSKEIREKAEMIGARHLADVYWFWTCEEYAYSRLGAWYVYMDNGGVDNYFKDNDCGVLALSAFHK